MGDYFSALLQGMTSLLQWPTFGLLLLGVGIGLLFGFIPGMGWALAFAIFLPFVFPMQPVEAFAFLIGMQAVMNTAGECTAIMFGVPGQRSATAVLLDGLPIARQGEPGRALGLSLWSSLFGGVIGVVVLMAFIPIARPLVLAMGNPELFMLVVLAIVFVGVLARGRMIPGLLGAAIGFMLGMIGPSPVTAEQRYSFGLLSFWDGFPLVPVALGLFAIPELINLARRGTASAAAVESSNEVSIAKGLRRGGRENLKHWRLVLQASGVSTVLGFLPGIGGSATQWIVYAGAKARSKNPEKFGKGAPEGVIAPGAGTNAEDGGALATTIAFGIPGSAGMALILSALIVVGVKPGPDMMSVNLDTTMSFAWALFFAQVLGAGVLLLTMRWIARITHLRSNLVLPFVVAFVFIGAYVSTNSFLGVLLTIGVGLIGYFMALMDWPRAPLILAFVLAPLAESYLWLTYQLYGWSWLSRPVVIGIFIVICFYVVYVFRRGRKPPSESEALEAGGADERVLDRQG